MSQPRIPLEPRQMYHIWTHAIGEENLFRTNENYRYFLQKYEYYIYPVAETFAYCLMPNHLHLMVRIRSKEKILDFLKSKKKKTLQGFSNLVSRQFSHLFNSYTQSYNKLYNRKGSLFIPNFRRKHINSDNYFGTLIAYIHNNPVHHGFTVRPDEWVHTSWHAYLSDNKRTKINRKTGIKWFGDKEEFLRVHHEIRMEKLIPLLEG